MSDHQLLTLWLGAFRYYLGRRSYAVSDFCELLAQQWPNLPKRTQDLIKKELDKEVERDTESRTAGYEFHHLGDDCDRNEWLLLQQRIESYDATT
jgi:hypothetical protein